MILLDTNVISAIMNRQPAVLDWAQSVEPSQFHLCATSIVEIEFGLQRLPEGKRRAALSGQWLKVLERWASRTFVIDLQVARVTGTVMAARERAGTPISIADAQIAGVALTHRAALATRNVRDFQGLGLTIVDPWAA